VLLLVLVLEVYCIRRIRRFLVRRGVGSRIGLCIYPCKATHASTAAAATAKPFYTTTSEVTIPIELVLVLLLVLLLLLGHMLLVLLL
jgi:hypothetical protein